MKATVEVESRAEAKSVQLAMSDATTKAYVVIMGVLMTLPSKRARLRVLCFAEEQTAELPNEPDPGLPFVVEPSPVAGDS